MTSPGRDDHLGELTDDDLDQLLAAANKELLAHVKAASDPTSALSAIMARAADGTESDEPARGTAVYPGAPAAGAHATPGARTPPPGFRRLNGRRQATRRIHRRRRPHAEPSLRPPTRASLPWWARALAALVLLIGGFGLGMHLHDSGARAAGNKTGNTTTSNISLGPVASPPCTPHQPNTTPELCVSRPYGDGYTVYIIHGTGFAPFAAITVKLVGVGVSPDHPIASPDHPVTDLQGTFSYAVDQGHRFFSGPIPPGVYQVTATAPGGRSVSARFRVNGTADDGPLGAPPP